MKKLIQTILAIAFLGLFFQNPLYSTDPAEKSSCIDAKIKVSILYDNYDFKVGLKSNWGFSCLIEGAEKTILFDTGTKSGVFKQNFNALNIDAENINCIVISHNHYDHTGGLESILEMNNKVSVYMIESFSDKTKKHVNEKGVEIIYEPKIKEICQDVYLSGTIGDQIEEQSLAIDTPKGLVVITGCSHPGINKILEHFKNSLNKEIYMVFGGFHLMRKSDAEMNSIITEMKNLGVKKCGATHCTGDKQIELFKQAFGENYVQMGVGNIIEL